MKTPFTIEQFLGVFKDYNLAMFPLQGIFYAVALFAIYLAMAPMRNSGKVISGILAFFWLWMGIVYHLVFFTTINKAAYLFGISFVLQGILFLIYGVIQNKLSFRFHPDKYGISAIILLTYALIVYPVLGFFMGHFFPYAPTFGLPCPTTIFTFGLLLLCNKRCPLPILIIPALWSVIGFTAAIHLGILEDFGLIASGLIAFFALVFRSKKVIRTRMSVPANVS